MPSYPFEVTLPSPAEHVFFSPTIYLHHSTLLPSSSTSTPHLLSHTPAEITTMATAASNKNHPSAKAPAKTVVSLPSLLPSP